MVKILINKHFIVTAILVCVASADKISFIRSFIANDQQSAIVTFHGLCWPLYEQSRLVKQLSKGGVISSGSVDMMMHKFSHNNHQLLFLADLDCEDVDLVLTDATARNLFRTPHRWLVLTNRSATNRLGMNLLMDAPILSDSDLVLAEEIENGYKMIELYKPARNATMQQAVRRYYSNGTIQDTRPHRSLFRRRQNVMKSPIIMMNVIQYNNSTRYHLPKEDRLEPEYDVTGKVCWSFVHLAMQMLNATPAYDFSYRWGYIYNGKWTGMIKDLIEYKADIGSNIRVTEDRRQAVAVTDMASPLTLKFILRQPPLSFSANIYSLPFSSNVWLALIMCSAVTAVFMMIVTKWEMNFGRSPTQLDGSIGDSLLLTMAAVSQQGCHLEPRRLPGRIILWFSFAALMALYAAYSAFIVVLLQSPSNAITSLQELLDSKISLAALEVDYSHFVFKPFTDPLRVEVQKRIEPDNSKFQYYSLEEGVERIRKGQFALHAVVEPIYRQIEKTFQEREKCDLIEIDVLDDPDPLLPVSKKSPYLELFKVVFKQLNEAGFRAVLNDRMQASKPKCSTHTAAFSSVGMMDFKPALIMLLYGNLLAVFIAVVEYCVFIIKQRQRRRKPKVEILSNSTLL